MDEWIEAFATALGEEPIEPKEMGALLRVSREVAHRVQRRHAPLSTYLIGLHVGRRVAEGASRGLALDEAIDVTNRVLPSPPPGENSEADRA